jgi:hypothetical protein
MPGNVLGLTPVIARAMCRAATAGAEGEQGSFCSCAGGAYRQSKEDVAVFLTLL